MADCVENGVLDETPKDSTTVDKSAHKLSTTQQGELPKHNGVACDVDSNTSIDSKPDNLNCHNMEWSTSETNDTGEHKNGAGDDTAMPSAGDDVVKVNGSEENSKESSNDPAQSENSLEDGENSQDSFKDAGNEQKSEEEQKEPMNESGEVSMKDSADSNGEVAPSKDNPVDDKDVSEEEEEKVHGKSSIKEEENSDINANADSNLSAPASSGAEVNASQDISIVSEDSSRDSSDSSVSGKSAQSGNEGDVNLKDDDGGDILITLNVEKDEDDMSKSDMDTSEKDENVAVHDVKANKAGDSGSTVTKQNGTNAMDLTVKPSVPAAATPTAAAAAQKVGTSTSTVLIQGNVAAQQIPYGAQIVQQGSQYGYVTKVGNQSLFVPVSASVAANMHALNQASGQAQLGHPIGSAILNPQSSVDMIERMRFELQNRIPDNHNWSVAFHPKKDELSSITSYLLELGHDVVKEAVYKDIIKIQTKKKEENALKDNEIESLEKMKTVYENTKKKVDHLQLKKVDCDGCRFRTESAVVLNHHKDFPHYDPPWDMSKGWMLCARCKYRTRVLAQFSFHMESVHKTQAKLLEKPQLFQCELCPLNTTTKNKLDKHRQKCIKHFKLNVNLQPYYHDVNFCMKTCYYKPKKIIPKPQPPAPAIRKQTPPPPRPTMQTRQSQQVAPKLQNFGRPQIPTKPVTTTPVRQPPPLQPRQRMPQPRPVTPQQTQQQRPAFVGGRPPVRGTMTPRTPVPQQRPVRPPAKEMSGFEVCELCGGYVKDRQALRIHFYYAHKVEMPQAIFSRPVPPLSCDVCQSKFWTTQGLSKHKSTLRHYANQTTVQSAPSTPSANQTCFMCSRKVTNLFVHIEQYHGMTMKDLVAMRKCIMCGITAADRRSLETHMASAHGVLIKTNDILGPEKSSANQTSAASPQVPVNKAASAPVMNRPSVRPSPLARNNLCVFCQIQFADNVQLTMHCIKVHATCTDCGMVVANSKNLTNHSCKQVKRSCSVCGLKNIAPDIYAEHIKTHVKACNVTLTRMSAKDISAVRHKVKKEYKPQIITLDTDDDSDLEIADKKKDDDADDAGVIRKRMGPLSKTRIFPKVKKDQGSGAAAKEGGALKVNSEKIEITEEVSDSSDGKPEDTDVEPNDTKDSSAGKSESKDSETSEKDTDNEANKNIDSQTCKDTDNGTNNKRKVDSNDNGEDPELCNETSKKQKISNDEEQTQVEVKQESIDTNKDNTVTSDKCRENEEKVVKAELDHANENTELPDECNESNDSDPINKDDGESNSEPLVVKTETLDSSDHVSETLESLDHVSKSPCEESESKQGVKRGLDESNESGIASDDDQACKRIKSEVDSPIE